MPKKSKGLTFEQHAELGRELHHMRERLVEIHVMASNTYTQKEFARLSRAVSVIDQARSDLEEHLFKEHPEQATVYIYYPQKRQNE